MTCFFYFQYFDEVIIGQGGWKDFYIIIEGGEHYNAKRKN